MPQKEGSLLPSQARWLLPVVALVLAVFLAITGLADHAKSTLRLPAGRSARSAGVAHVTARTGTGISAAVGAIPGVSDNQRGRWTFGSGVADTSRAVATKRPPAARRSAAQRQARLLPADILVVGGRSLPVKLAARVRRIQGVAAAIPVDAGRVRVDGVFVNVLGVNPAKFRWFAAGPTARSNALWANVAAGGMAISFTMGSQDRLSLDEPVTVSGVHPAKLPVAGFGTVGIGGVDAVVSHTMARSLGLPIANAIIVSAPHARLDRLMAKIGKLTPKKTAVAALVTQVIEGKTTVTTGAAGAIGVGVGHGRGLTPLELATFLAAAESRVGMRYVWGGDGPTQFDCSGLVHWSLAQAGVVMPRVAADQARTGPLLPLSDLRPGDLLFYHTDPTAPDYISHVAIYIGNDEMLQAPEPGMNVEIVRADFGAGFAGAVRIYPRVAAAVAGNLAA
jgi:peptidoglycan DL-endopeptidase CwlO